MKKYDLILKNGHVLDPVNDRDEKMDVALKDGVIAAVEKDLPSSDANKIMDISGSFITPGLIDAHVHCYHSSGIAQAWAGDLSLQPDYHSFRTGVTTWIDTGSAGSYNLKHFKATVIDRVKTRVMAYVNIADYGMASLMGEQFPDQNDFDAMIECYEELRNDLVGIKIAHYNNPDWKDVLYAKRVQEQLSVPIMVDFGVFRKERPFAKLISEYLDKGDIATHCFRGPVPVLDDEDKVYDYLWNAKDSGIKFDLGHGAGSFIFRNAVPALSQGFYPDSVSTDLHALSINGLAIDLPTTMSKVKACCSISWLDLFRLVTSSPAEYIGHPELGTLNVGGVADVSVWNVRNGNFCFKDTGGGSLRGLEKLECEMTFRAGDLVWDLNGREAVPYQDLPSDYGFDHEREEIVNPL